MRIHERLPFRCRSHHSRCRRYQEHQQLVRNQQHQLQKSGRGCTCLLRYRSSLRLGSNEVRRPDSSDPATVTVVHQCYRQRLDTDWCWRAVSSYTELDDLYVEVTTTVSCTHADGVCSYWYVGCSYGVVALTVVSTGLHRCTRSSSIVSS